MKKLFNPLLFIFLTHLSYAQVIDVKANYESAFEEMHQMLKGELPLSFKRAVFLTENAYLENQISYEEFQKVIDRLTRLTKAVANTDDLSYNKKDRKQVLLAGSIFRAMKDTLVIEDPERGTSFKKYPFTYDTTDFTGENDWTKMFVIKLLATQTGNCHSLPILYKILAVELEAEAWLSITPNHTYIKQWNDKTGWYNTELTTGRFPYDAEIKNNSYIKTEAIAAGVYMDTLTDKENIAYAITDLAQGYLRKTAYEDMATPVRWLDAALVYYPDFPNALILKSELLKRAYESAAEEKEEKNLLRPGDAELKRKFEELEKSYYAVHQIGYRRMPKEMYLNWLYRVKKDTTRKPHKFESPQPFKDYNYKVPVMTASDGYNYEFFDQEETTRIGTVILNRLTHKIVKFIEPDQDDFSDVVISRMYDPIVGRFWQIDPLTEVFYDLSPYNFVNDNPVRFTDPSGMAPWDSNNDEEKNGGPLTNVEESKQHTNSLARQGMAEFTDCETCPKGDKKYDPYRDDHNNNYTYTPEDGGVSMDAGEVTVTPDVAFFGSKSSTKWLHSNWSISPETQWTKDFKRFAGGGANAITGLIAAPFAGMAIGESLASGFASMPSFTAVNNQALLFYGRSQWYANQFLYSGSRYLYSAMLGGSSVGGFMMKLTVNSNYFIFRHTMSYPISYPAFQATSESLITFALGVKTIPFLPTKIAYDKNFIYKKSN